MRLWKNKKKVIQTSEFERLVLDMGCTAKFMPTQDDVVSDEEILLRLETLQELEERDREGRTALINAACYGRNKVVAYLLRRGADLLAQDDEGFTALHMAVISEDLPTIRLLLDAGAEVNAKNDIGNNPIMLCNLGTDIEVFQTLLAYGADPDQKNYYDVSAKDVFAYSDSIREVLMCGKKD